MIYLIITTTIIKHTLEERDHYIRSINKTLECLPPSIKPIIIENRALSPSYLDNFFYKGRNHVKVFYTSTMYSYENRYKNRYIDEIVDIQEIIDRYGIEDDDIIIKLTGLHYPISSSFFNEIINNETTYDAFIKFYDIYSQIYTTSTIVSDFYAIKVKYIKLLNHNNLYQYESPDIAFAKYIYYSGLCIKKINSLGIRYYLEDTYIQDIV